MLFRFLKWSLGILILLILSRSVLFNLTIRYTITEKRTIHHIEDSKIITQLDQYKLCGDLSIDEIIRAARKLTAQQLYFATSHTTTNPNHLFHLHRATCVGYASFFSAVVNYLIQCNGLIEEYRVNHLVGHLFFLGINLHSLFDHPFFQDHDFSVIENLKTGNKTYIDPSVSDYFRIHRITVKN